MESVVPSVVDPHHEVGLVLPGELVPGASALAGTSLFDVGNRLAFSTESGAEESEQDVSVLPAEVDEGAVTGEHLRGG